MTEIQNKADEWITWFNEHCVDGPGAETRIVDPRKQQLFILKAQGGIIKLLKDIANELADIKAGRISF